ncbi:MAG TPA: glucokinase [Candidatus Saccharimonadales bacterium]
MTNTQSPHTTTRIVCGMDAGGTQISVLSSADGEIVTLPPDFGSMPEAIRWVVEHFGLPELLYIGGAGALDAQGNIEMTNRPAWPVFNPEEFGEEIGCKIVVVNDMIIKAAALELDDVEIDLLRDGTEDPEGTKTIITVSSGVNNAQLFPDRTTSSAEGGHTTWQPISELEDAVLQALRELHGSRLFSVEELIGGKSLLKLYDALNKCGYSLKNELHRQCIEQCRRTGTGIGPFITQLALAGEPFCVRFMGVFASVLGQYMRNTALFTLPTAGIYVTGGVMQPDVARYVFAQQQLMAAFLGGNKHNELLSQIPIYLVLDQNMGVKGALRLALRS